MKGSISCFYTALKVVAQVNFASWKHDPTKSRNVICRSGGDGLCYLIVKLAMTIVASNGMALCYVCHLNDGNISIG